MRAPIKETREETAKKATAEQVSAYRVEELVTLYRHATQWERSLMLPALNCGFGTGELETLRIDEVYLARAHGHYDMNGSWIKRVRSKRAVYGEWSLWPETVEAVRWLMERRTKTKAKGPLLIVKKTGRPIGELTAGNDRSREAPNAWARLTDRIRESESAFRKLSVNELRKTAADLVRRASDGETASVFITHGTPVKSDPLLDRSADKDFRRVFETLERAPQQLAPMFDQPQG
jgi:hypothetical protein